MGQVLDGKANESIRRMVLLNLVNPRFKECLMVALKATKLFDTYETVQ